MAEVSYPSSTYNSGAVTDAEYERVMARATDNGVHGTPSDTPVVTAGSGLQVLIKANKVATVRGLAWDSGTSDTAMAIAPNGAGTTRYDWVVLRLDRSTWQVRAAIVQGTAGSGTPAITRDVGTTGKFEVTVARVTVPSGASSVTVQAICTYVGSRVRVANDGFSPPGTEQGEIQYRPNTGEWRGWTGTEWKTLYEDTGVLPLGAGYSTWTPQYDCVATRRNGWVWARIWVKRIGSNLAAGDNGTVIATMPPSLVSTYHNFFTGVFNDGATCQVEIQNTGDIWVVEPSETVEVGRTMALTVCYPQF